MCKWTHADTVQIHVQGSTVVYSLFILFHFPYYIPELRWVLGLFKDCSQWDTNCNEWRGGEGSVWKPKIILGEIPVWIRRSQTQIGVWFLFYLQKGYLYSRLASNVSQYHVWGLEKSKSWSSNINELKDSQGLTVNLF